MVKCREKNTDKERGLVGQLRIRKKYRVMRKNVYKCLQKELRYSTTHGLSYLVDNNYSKMEKLFWLLSFVICMGFAIVLLSAQYWRYITAPTVVSVEMNYFDWNISYPAISICPLYKGDPVYLSKVVNETFERTGLNFESYLWAITQSAMDTLEYFDLKIPKEVLPFIHPKDYATIAAKLFRKLGNSISTNPQLPISVEAAMTEMGMCHIINSNVAIFDKPENWNASLTYKKKNIEVSIYDKDFYIEINKYANVYKVFIHSPDEVTLRTTPSFTFDVEGIMAFGLSVWSTRISEELRHHSLRLRKCRFTNEPLGSRYPVYSYNHCILECRIKMIKRLCGCVPHFYKPLGHEQVCYIHELQCVLKYRREIVTLAATKETLRESQYSHDTATHSRDCGCLSSCELDLYYKDRENYVPKKGVNKLSIGITTYPKVRIVRDIIFSFYDILLRSGGVINLCIGSSLISIAEIVVATIKIIGCAITETARLFL